MNAASATFCQVEPVEIGDRLQSLLYPFSDGEGVFSASSAENIIVLMSDRVSDEELEDLLITWTQLAPGRYFVISERDSLESPEAALAAYCQILSGGDHICSEVVKLDIPKGDMETAKSIYLHNRLSGVDASLYLHADNLHPAALSAFLPYSSQVIFDSEVFQQRTEVLRALLASPCRLVDLNWIYTGIWRQELRRAFDFTPAFEQIPDLTEVAFFCAGNSRLRCHPQAALISGWLLERLGLRLSCVSHRGFECGGAGGRKLDLILKPSGVKSSERSGITDIELFFKETDDSAVTAKKPAIELRADELLITNIHIGAGAKTTSKITEKTTTYCLDKHFLVGESLKGYRGALSNYLEMIDLSNALA